jgi:hypothetical protein
MKKKDIFERNEEKLLKWVTTHHIGLAIVSIVLSVWVALSLATISILGIIGAEQVADVIEEQYQNGGVTYEAHHLIMDIILPIVKYMFDTVGYIIAIIGIVSATWILYFSYRAAYRWRKDNL